MIISRSHVQQTQFLINVENQLKKVNTFSSNQPLLISVSRSCHILTYWYHPLWSHNFPYSLGTATHFIECLPHQLVWTWAPCTTTKSSSYTCSFDLSHFLFKVGKKVIKGSTQAQKLRPYNSAKVTRECYLSPRSCCKLQLS